MATNPLDWIDPELSNLEAQHLRRRAGTRSSPQGARIVIDGREFINFGSNDYLGLAADPRLLAAIAGTGKGGSGASPLVTGRDTLHAELEQRLAEFEGTQAALLFPTGFAANLGTIAALVGRGDVIFSDARNHASIIDGCRLSRADVEIYPHNDVGRVRNRLKAASRFRRRLIVTDALFSMDGDFAPLAELAALAEQHDAMLMIDEAHSTGVFGRHGRGVAEQLGVGSGAHIKVGTLSKALGVSGGFVAGSRALIDWLFNRARTYVFSTAPPPAQSAAALVALDVIRDEPVRRQQLQARAAQLRSDLHEHGWNTGTSASQIIPVVVGPADQTIQFARVLQERGLFVPGIRPPTVPEGESLLRISLSYAHTEAMVDRLLGAMDDLKSGWKSIGSKS